MAKTEGDQNVPAEWLDAYRATLGEQRPNKNVWKRYPYRVPRMQDGHGNVTAAQRRNRQTFKDGIAKFKKLTPDAKQRWYATMPVWGSYLWYYNWFMLNGIPNLWGVVPGGGAILKNIQHIKDSIPTGGKQVSIPITVAPTQCVVMLNGNSWKREDYYTMEWNAYYGVVVYPIYTNFLPTAINIEWAFTPHIAAGVTITIIEYI